MQLQQVVVDDVKPIERSPHQLETLFDHATLRQLLDRERPVRPLHRAQRLYWARRGFPWPTWAPGWAWVTQSLAVGCAESSDAPGRLASAGLHAVLSCRARSEADDWRRRAAFAEHGLIAHQIGWPDCAPPTRQALRRASRWVLDQIEAGRRVFVHCRFGVGRSALVAMAVLVEQGATAEEAYWRVCQVRPLVFPNMVQTRALVRYATALGR